MNGMDPADRRGRGRPRSIEADRAILEATWQVLARQGYEGLTFEAVAQHAGCSRSTLYRRFDSKIALVSAMLHGTSRLVEPVFAAGEDIGPRAVLIAHAAALVEFVSGVRGKALLSLIVSGARTPDLNEARLRHVGNERALYYAEFVRLAPSPPDERTLSFAFDTLVGSIFYMTAMRDQVLTGEDVAALVDRSIALLGVPR